VDEPPLTIARRMGPRGEVVLRRRGTADGAVDELIVNGAFAMDSAETGSERALAALARPGARVLVGGLGLGFTVEALVERRVESVDVVEIEQALVDWARDGVTPRLGRVAGDPRVRLWVGDVRAVLTEPVQPLGPAGPWDAILLDVDNGPRGLTRATNDWLYSWQGLEQAWTALKPGGILAVWSAFDDRAFTRRMERGGFEVECVGVRSRGKQGGHKHYVWVGVRVERGEKWDSPSRR
jgi:spermidine synthase